MDQRKKNLRLLILLVTLLTVTVALFFFGKSNSSGKVDSTLFQTDLTTVDRVVLEGQGDVVTLQYDGSRWRVNDQLADAAMVDVLFATLQQATPKRAVSSRVRDSLNAMMDQRGVRVSLYTGDTEQQVLQILGNSARTETYFRKPDQSASYVMVIPGYRVYVAGIFEMKEGGWRDKYVFNFNWRNFQGLAVTFPETPEMTEFQVVLQKDLFTIDGMSQIDTAKLNTFLDDVSLLRGDEFPLRTPSLDSLAKTSRVDMAIQIRDIGGKTYNLAIYKPISGFHQRLALYQGNQFVLFDERKVQQLRRSREFFITKK